MQQIYRKFNKQERHGDLKNIIKNLAPCVLKDPFPKFVIPLVIQIILHKPSVTLLSKELGNSAPFNSGAVPGLGLIWPGIVSHFLLSRFLHPTKTGSQYRINKKNNGL